MMATDYSSMTDSDLDAAAMKLMAERAGLLDELMKISHERDKRATQKHLTKTMPAPTPGQLEVLKNFLAKHTQTVRSTGLDASKR